jgi:hypothetical protein
VSDLKPRSEADDTPLANPERRRLAQLGGALLPGILTLAARPTWATTGVQCLSNRMSGNLSQPDTLACSFGRPVNTWKSNKNLWTPTGCQYGTLKKGKSATSTNPYDYTGGTTFGTHFPGSTVATKPMRQVMADSPTSVEAIFAAALLSGLADPAYSPNPVEVKQLYSNPGLWRTGATRSQIATDVLLPTFGAF